MGRVYTTAFINRPVEVVFNYVTTASNWPEWHLSSMGVNAVKGKSLEIGDRVTEDFCVAGKRGRVIWTAIDRRAPSYWVIRGEVEGGGGGTITYNLTPEGKGTKFEREFVYKMPNAFLDIIDFLFIESRIKKESSKAVSKLKQVLESR
ncbi:MAG: SRPBCC family protein [Blastocatellia bacterium]|nr:SRPBCC family protein [Blastocatellia bacterium]